MKNNAKGLAILVAVLGFILVVFAQKSTVKVAEPGLKVPDAGAVRIMKLQLDMVSLEKQGQELARQMGQLNQTYQHDQKELEDIKADVIKADGRSVADWDIDVKELKFIPRAKVAKK